MSLVLNKLQSLLQNYFDEMNLEEFKKVSIIGRWGDSNKTEYNIDAIEEVRKAAINAIKEEKDGTILKP